MDKDDAKSIILNYHPYMTNMLALGASAFKENEVAWDEVFFMLNRLSFPSHRRGRMRKLITKGGKDSLNKS